MNQNNIFLIGFMGAGKSTVADRLSQNMTRKLIEMDEMLADRAGMPIAEIFEQFGEAYFRKMETQLLIDLQQERHVIVSCGGGAVMREENVSYMKECGKIILLTAEPETIYERVRYSTGRPILNGHMNVEYIRELMEKRRGRYEAVADIKVATDGQSVDEICAKIQKKLGAEG